MRYKKELDIKESGKMISLPKVLLKGRMEVLKKWKVALYLISDLNVGCSARAREILQ